MYSLVNMAHFWKRAKGISSACDRNWTPVTHGLDECLTKKLLDKRGYGFVILEQCIKTKWSWQHCIVQIWMWVCCCVCLVDAFIKWRRNVFSGLLDLNRNKIPKCSSCSFLGNFGYMTRYDSKCWGYCKQKITLLTGISYPHVWIQEAGVVRLMTGLWLLKSS